MTLPNPVDFSGRSVIVTGGTKGIGYVISETFLAAGANVLVCGRNEPENYPPPTVVAQPFVPRTSRDPADAAALVQDAVERFGRLDVLVNNAGGSPDADAATVSPRFVEKIVALNLLAPLQRCPGRKCSDADSGRRRCHHQHRQCLGDRSAARNRGRTAQPRQASSF